MRTWGATEQVMTLAVERDTVTDENGDISSGFTARCWCGYSSGWHDTSNEAMYDLIRHVTNAESPHAGLRQLIIKGGQP